MEKDVRDEFPPWGPEWERESGQRSDVQISHPWGGQRPHQLLGAAGDQFVCVSLGVLPKDSSPGYQALKTIHCSNLQHIFEHVKSLTASHMLVEPAGGVGLSPPIREGAGQSMLVGLSQWVRGEARDQ